MDRKLVRDFYKKANATILKSPANQWGCDPYAWDMAGIRLTPIEKWLWHDIRAVDAVLYPQYPVLGFFADFANPVAKVVIECDGAGYHKNKEADAKRDQAMRDAGWSVYRISGKHCRDGAESDGESNSYAREFIQSIANSHGIARP